MNNDIQDNEIRVIGQPRNLHGGTSGRQVKRKWIVAVVLIAVAAVMLLLLHKADTTDAFAPVDSVLAPAMEPNCKYTEPETDADAYAEYVKITAGDVVLDIYIPHNAVPKLSIGDAILHDENVIMAFQAADVRADNGKIVGAFVLAGEPVAWGLSKKGYCAIIDGRISIGTADNSPLFEEATVKGGYFFRQYSIVENGIPSENRITSSAIRKALCCRGSEIFVAIGETPLTFSAFSQALVEIGVDNAIYLMGGNSYGFYRGEGNSRLDVGTSHHPFLYENYILWETK